MDKAMFAHKRKLSTKMNNLKPGILQEFWKLLKKGKTREQPSNLIDTLFESFKKLKT
jgi:hypothetical protein